MSQCSTGMRKDGCFGIIFYIFFVSGCTNERFLTQNLRLCTLFYPLLKERHDRHLLIEVDKCEGERGQSSTGSETPYTFFFISTPFFSAQPGVAYCEAVFEPQVCLDVCLTNLKAFIYEITKKVVLNTIKLGNLCD